MGEQRAASNGDASPGVAHSGAGGKQGTPSRQLRDSRLALLSFCDPRALRLRLANPARQGTKSKLGGLRVDRGQSTARLSCNGARAFGRISKVKGPDLVAAPRSSSVHFWKAPEKGKSFLSGKRVRLMFFWWRFSPRYLWMESARMTNLDVVRARARKLTLVRRLAFVADALSCHSFLVLWILEQAM